MAQNGIIRPFDHQLSLIQHFIDALIIIVTLSLSYWLYHQTFSWTDKYTITAIAAVVLFYLAAKINNLYRSYRIAGFIQEIKPLMLSWLSTIAGLLVLGYSFKSTHELSRVVFGMWAVATPIILYGWRMILRHTLEALRAKGYNTRSVVIVGIDENAKELAKNIIHMPWTGLVLKGFISQNYSGEVIANGDESWSVLGDMDYLFDMARNNEVDIVYLAIPMHERSNINHILKVLGDSTVSIFMVPDFYTAEMMQGAWVTVGDSPTVSVIDCPTRGINSWAKRFEDIVLASFVLTLFAVPMIIIALGVKLSSPGPVLYKQHRYGMNGKSISVWKFRSMVVTEDDGEFVQAKKNDTRITPFGGFLRRTSLDELPQLFNVLMGDMSIVGPRPHAAAHNEEFRGKIYGYMLRYKVKPGITGLAQIKGHRGETDTNEKMERRIHYDVQYIHHWSIWLDLIILLKTPFALIRGENAY